MESFIGNLVISMDPDKQAWASPKEVRSGARGLQISPAYYTIVLSLSILREINTPGRFPPFCLKETNILKGKET